MRESRILIVDDEQAVASTLREFFRSCELDVDCASGFDEAIEKLGRSRYGAVLADVQLSRIGDTQGLDLAGFVRETYPDTGFIVLTAYGSHQLEWEARKRGVSFFLHKPVRLEDIGQIVFGLLGLSKDLATRLPHRTAP
jgi:two-component system, NtrC family, response regulator PilR